MGKDQGKEEALKGRNCGPNGTQGERAQCKHRGTTMAEDTEQARSASGPHTVCVHHRKQQTTEKSLERSMPGW